MMILFYVYFAPKLKSAQKTNTRICKIYNKQMSFAR